MSLIIFPPQRCGLTDGLMDGYRKVNYRAAFLLKRRHLLSGHTVTMEPNQIDNSCKNINKDRQTLDN